MLDILTHSDRKKHTTVERATEFERILLFLLRRAGWSAHICPEKTKDYSIEIFRPSERVAVQTSNTRSKTKLAQVETFLEFLKSPKARQFDGGVFISSRGFSPSVYAYLREEGVENLRLGILRNERLYWDTEDLDKPGKKDKTTYIGVFTCKGGVGKTTISAHLAGAFAMNGYDVALIDLDHQQNLRKLLGEKVFLPDSNGRKGAGISVISHDDWEEGEYQDKKVVVCDCNPEFYSNPASFIRKFDYCIIPTTLNPMGVNKNGDVIKRTFSAIRGENKKARLLTLINNYQPDEGNRNILLSQVLKSQFKQFSEKDPKCTYIDPEEVAIRYSKQLLYWGLHIYDGSQPSLAFGSRGGYSYPRMDFLKLVDYLESNTDIERSKFISALAAA